MRVAYQKARGLLCCLLLLAAAIPLWACGSSYEVAVTVNGTTAKGTVTVDGELKTFEGTVGTDGCVRYNIDGCQGEVCGCQPGSQFKVTCKDPLLAEWPDAWTLTSATWTLLDDGTGGQIYVWPAATLFLPPGYGAIVTDPGYSAWVMKLDAPGDVGPGTFELELTFDIPDGTPGCVKGFDVAVVEFMPPGIFPTTIVPTDPAMGLDFTQFQPGDPNVFCFDFPTPVEEDGGNLEGGSWGRIKSIYR